MLFASISLAAPPKPSYPRLSLPKRDTISPILVTATIVPTVTSQATTTTSSVVSSINSAQSPIATIPVPVPEPKAGVYVCEDINWGGKCEHKFSPLGSSDADCTLLAGTESSIGPDIGFYCEFYTNAYCRKLMNNGSDFLGIYYPGTADLRSTAKGNMNDRFYSYICLNMLS
ncbi:hypothetical protein EJ02DRAFT_434342 [Clathrospora elynae]|uniref:Uncharacterized protein n=1 Tax=Clathrospora elynae TaxID=706981 RepID=A0A6A5SQL6_9PLEO|nr:hypothetical protein EJ02DRAFT_434342 [Clathrospora elynae]